MAEAGLFTGWGPPVRGREAKGLEVFNEAVSFYGKQQESGGIESFEVVFSLRTAATSPASFWPGARRNRSPLCGWTTSFSA
jgi:hypothetical protein